MRLLIFIFCWLIFISPVFAENFYIDNYDIKIIVDKNKSANITEDLDVYFTNHSHGIFRNIPYKNATITDINVSEQANITHNRSNVNIKIGDPSTLVFGKHHYTIKYKYNYHDNQNEFYHNIIGTEWATDIRHVNFDVTLPKNIQSSDVGLSIGKYGTIGFNGGAVYSINGNYIYGHTSKTLLPYEGITIKITVPEGYFNKYVNHMSIYIIISSILITLIAFSIWFIYGKDEPIIPIVNFHVPNNLTPLELELAYKGQASTKGLTGMLIDLAGQGYIKINAENDDWSLQKIKDYEGKNYYYKQYMNALFYNQSALVNKSDIEYSPFYTAICEHLINMINQSKNKFLNAKSISFSVRFFMFLCLVSLVILIVNTIQIDLTINLSTLITEIVALIITSICFYQLPQRNKIGQKLLNEIAGLKHFIEVAEKSRLQSLLNEDPEYFYKILPSAYILDISDKWISKFKLIAPIKPTWYEGRQFNVSEFNRFTNDMHTLQIHQDSIGYSSDHSSSSGEGGYSGGGGGGGGGGSW